MQSVLNILNATSNAALFSGLDTTTLLIALASNDAGSLALFNNWIQQPALADGTPAVLTALSLRLSGANMQVLVSNTLALNVQQRVVDQLSAFYAAQTLPYNITAGINFGVSRAAANIAWTASEYQPLAQYLLSNQWRTATSSSSSSSSSSTAVCVAGKSCQHAADSLAHMR